MLAVDQPLVRNAGALRVSESRGGSTRFYAMERHVLGLFHAVTGARAFRRHLAVESIKPDAGPDVLRQALARVSEARLGVQTAAA